MTEILHLSAITDSALPGPILQLPARKRRTRHAAVQIYTEQQDSNLQQDYNVVANLVKSDETQVARKSCSDIVPLLSSSTQCSLRHSDNARSSYRQNKSDVSHAASPVATSVPIFKQPAESSFHTDENVPPADVDTPTTNRFRNALTGKIPLTPRRGIHFSMGKLPPRTPQSKSGSTSRKDSVYTDAKALFAPSGTNGKIIGRDEERNQLRQFISNAIENGRGGCTYISGPPGTGKSALVREIFEEVQDRPSLNATFINCVGIKNPKDVHSRLLQDLSPTSTMSPKASKNMLSDLFAVRRSSDVAAHLVVLDELDSLLDAQCEVLYTLFNWALSAKSTLLLIGIANALDLTDRFLPQLKARNLKPELLTFNPYNARQMTEIISQRLRSILPPQTSANVDFVPFVHPAAIQLCSKKVATQTGDLRKAFNLIRQAITLIENETINTLTEMSSPSKPLTELVNAKQTFPHTPPENPPFKDVSVATNRMCNLTAKTAPRATIAHVARLSSAIFNSGTTSRLSGLNLQQKAVLSALVARESTRSKRDPFSTPSKSASRVLTVEDLFSKYFELCKRDDCLLQPLKITEFRDVVASLETLGLVHESVGRSSSLLTPTHTPSRAGRNADDKQLISGVSKKEIVESLTGPGTDLLLRLFDA